MDFRDSPAEAAFRAEARAFLAAHAPARLPHIFDDAVEHDESELVASHRRWQETLFAHGWAALLWPVEFGGRGLGPVQQVIWSQELARAGLHETIFVVGIGMAGPTLIAHGTPEQKARYLDPMLRGEHVWCQLFSEPGAGSDLAALATRAVRDGDDWVVSGQKTWCSGGHYADFGILLARTDPGVPKHKGITYFLLDMRTPGVEIRPLRMMTGHAHFNEVFLNQVRIPDSARLGPVGQGWGVAMTTLMHERMAIGGIEGMLQVEELIAHLRQHREHLDDALRAEIGQLYARMRSLDLLNARVITKLGRGQNPAAEAAVMKLAIARVFSQATDLALRAMGPAGLARAGKWQGQFLSAPSYHIAGGTDEVQKNVAAERVLGLPREARIDRDLPFEKLPRS
jgi:alkylation response protein AidB-like acyl-CoA dehydrogenase